MMKNNFKKYLKPTAIWSVVLVIILFVGIIIWTFSTSSFFLIGGGSTSVRPILDDFTNRYERLPKGGQRILYNSIGSAAALTGVRNKSYAFGFLSETITDSLAHDLWVNNNVVRFAIAKDYIVIIYHLPNGVQFKPQTDTNYVDDKYGHHINFNSFNTDAKGGTGAQTMQKFYDKHETWASVFSNTIKSGGNVTPRTFTRENGSGTRKFFEDSVIHNESYTADEIVSSNGEMLQKINNTPNSIGYLSFGYLDSVLGKNPTSTNVKIAAVEVAKKPVVPYKIVTSGEGYTFNSVYNLSRPFTGIVNIDSPHIDAVLKFLAWIIDPGWASDLDASSSTAAYWMRQQGEEPITYGSDYWNKYNDDPVISGTKISSLYQLVYKYYTNGSLPGANSHYIYGMPKKTSTSAGKGL